MAKKKEQYPKCVIDLAETFKLKAGEVSRLISNPEGNKSLEDEFGQRVNFIFGDGAFFKVSNGKEKKSYAFKASGEFELLDGEFVRFPVVMVGKF